MILEIKNAKAKGYTDEQIAEALNVTVEDAASVKCDNAE